MAEMNASNIGHVIEGIGFEYGFDATGEFEDFGDEFKVKWIRMGRNIDFKVSDYLVGAPEEIFSEYISVVFKKITDWEYEPQYSPAAQEYIEKMKLARLARRMASEKA